MSKTVVRAFELPLSRADAGAWQLIRQCWKNSVMLANWFQTTMLRLDDPDLKKAPDFDLYARAFGRDKSPKDGDKRRKPDAPPLPLRKAEYRHRLFFAGASQSAVGICEKVHSDYIKNRYDVLVRLSKTLATYRSFPWPVTGQQVKEAWLDGSAMPHLRLTLPGGEVILKLRGGSEFGRQLHHFRQLIASGKPFKEIILREKRCRGGDCMVKMVAEIPVKEQTGDRSLVLLTDRSCFWVAELDGRQAWILNNDHWRRVVARHQQHLTTLQRMSEDAKAERRVGNNQAWQQQNRLDVLCENDRHRLASFTHEASCHLAEFARRQGVAEVIYLDRNKGFVPRFPWHELHTKLSAKLQERGIAFYSESSNGIVASALEDQPNEAWTDWSQFRCQRQIESRIIALRNLLAAQKRTGSHPKVSVPCLT